MSNPGEVWLSKLSKVVAGYGKRIDLLERAVKKQGVATGAKVLARLNDVFGVVYDPSDDRPTHGSVLAFMRDIDSAIGGGWTYRGGAVRFGDPITETAEGDLVVDQDVLPDWDPTQPCLVVATAQVGGDFDPVPFLTPSSLSVAVSGSISVEIDSTPAEIVFTDPLALSSADFALGGVGDPYMEPLPEGSLNLVPAEGFGIDHPYRAPVPLNITNGTAGGVATTVCVFGSGTPRVQCSLPIDSAAYPGDHTLTILTAVVPLVAVEQETP